MSEPFRKAILADFEEGSRVEILTDGDWLPAIVTWQRPRFNATQVRIEGPGETLSQAKTFDDVLPARRRAA